MSNGGPQVPDLTLQPIDGLELEPILVKGGAPVTLGRSPDCGIRLNDSAVSRQHTTIEYSNGHWLVADLGSRNGTTVNSVLLEARQRTPIEEGDLVTIGPWTFEVITTGRSASRTRTWSDQTITSSRVQTISSDELGTIARQRLALLMDCATATHTAATEAALADGVLDAALAGTSLARAALVRGTNNFDEVEVIDIRTVRPASANLNKFPLSASLLRAAAAGNMARLSDDVVRGSHSISDLGLTSALCAPVRVGTAIAAYLYLDDHGAQVEVPSDAAAFCDAVSRMCGLAMSNLQRHTLEGRQRQLEAQFGPAHDVQQRILPTESGFVGPVRYAMRSRPGQIVAGDLLDVVALDEHRTAVYIGDVTGKGLGPAMLMATSQAQLSLLLRMGTGLDEAVRMVNDYVRSHSAEHEFITLLLAVIDSRERVIRFVDAGHGHCLILRGDGEPQRLAGGGRLPLGVVDDADAPMPLGVEESPFGVNDRLLLYSDGVVEQRCDEGTQYGVARLIESVRDSESPESDVERVVEDVIRFAGTDSLADDMTVASVQLRTGGS